MCGIAGIINPERGPREGAERVSAMVQELRHRGPDDEGLWHDERVVFGMRRLSIIDLPGGRQPIWSDDGVGIVYNGEVYNYKALRAELMDVGVSFTTHSDTEVVLHAYRTWGISCLDRLEGMFALCIYDRRRREVHLARDRLGVKPLYLRRDGSELAFASEIKALVAGGRMPALDRQAIHDFLTLRYVPAPGTIWEGISKLEPGHRMRIPLGGGEPETERWWGVDFVSEDRRLDPSDERRFEQLFLEAVEKRLLAADVPVGVLLSGGLDSSAVSAAAVELGHRDFHTFSVGFSDPSHESELPYARRLADHLGSRHHEVEVDRDDFISFLPELVRVTDEPLADLASVPLYFVSRLARDQVKVVLSGEGADEILAGYNLDETAAALDRWRRLRFVPRPLLGVTARLAPSGRGDWLEPMASAGWSGLLRASRTNMTRVFDELEKRALWRDPSGLSSTETLVASWYEHAPSPHPLDQLQQIYCASWLVEDLLMKADKTTMANSLELRVPFLDHALVEWAAAAPIEAKVGSRQAGYSSKNILRRFAAGRVPHEIVTRPKRGFPVPAYEWLAGPLADWCRSQLDRGGGPLEEYFEPAQLGRVGDAAAAGQPPAAHQAWNLIILRHWLEAWT